MDKKNLFEYAEDPKVHQTVDSVIQELCKQHGSDLEQDIIALFEDIIQFFSGREEDFIDFESLPQDQKEAMYVEITTIIKILKGLKNSIDKQETMKTLSQSMLSTFSKSARQHGYIKDKHNIMTLEEQEKIKKEFINITLNELYRQQQQVHSKTPEPKIDIKAAEQYLKKISPQRTKFATATQKKQPIKKMDTRISPRNTSHSKPSQGRGI
jgi:hypothetical protein